MSSQVWKLKQPNGSSKHFRDIRRKVGNRILRAYLLEEAKKESRIEAVEGSLRGPNDEFKDFSKFFILRARNDDNDFQILVESGVYENLRIVATDSDYIAEKSPDAIIELFTDAMQHPEEWNSQLRVSPDSKLA